jgi:hypothetical protein
MLDGRGYNVIVIVSGERRRDIGLIDELPDTASHGDAPG